MTGNVEDIRYYLVENVFCGTLFILYFSFPLLSLGIYCLHLNFNVIFFRYIWSSHPVTRHVRYQGKLSQWYQGTSVQNVPFMFMFKDFPCFPVVFIISITNAISHYYFQKQCWRKRAGETGALSASLIRTYAAPSTTELPCMSTLNFHDWRCATSGALGEAPLTRMWAYSTSHSSNVIAGL